MNNRMKLNSKQVKNILAVTYPDYRGRKFTIEFCDTIHFHDTNWAGGTRNYYTFLNTEGHAVELPSPAPWVNPYEGLTVKIPDNILIIIHDYFCGKDCGIHIVANTSHLNRYQKMLV
jgi:hypothetical protein